VPVPTVAICVIAVQAWIVGLVSVSQLPEVGEP